MVFKDGTDAAGTADAATPAPDPSATAALEGKTGAEFDRAYIDMMVSGHEQAIAMFENAAQNASTEEARQLADDALPELEEIVTDVATPVMLACPSARDSAELQLGQCPLARIDTQPGPLNVLLVVISDI